MAIRTKGSGTILGIFSSLLVGCYLEGESYVISMAWPYRLNSKTMALSLWPWPCPYVVMESLVWNSFLRYVQGKMMGLSSYCFLRQSRRGVLQSTSILRKGSTSWHAFQDNIIPILISKPILMPTLITILY